MIHPTAGVSPKVQLDSTVEAGPFAVIDCDVASELEDFILM